MGSSSPSGSGPGCSTERGSRLESSSGLGRPRAGWRAVRGASCTISVGPPCATWCGPESRNGVAMQLSGHRTRSVFERYNVTSEGDFREAARKLTGIIPGTIQAQPAPTEGDGRRQPAPNHGQDRSENGGTPGRDRTCDLRIRSPSLCPTELRARRSPRSPAAPSDGAPRGEAGVSEGI